MKVGFFDQKSRLVSVIIDYSNDAKNMIGGESSKYGWLLYQLLAGAAEIPS